jgi:O-succinylbenzoic acid--CoA ligase
VRSALLADGYLWDEAGTARHFREGWFLMSDLGTLPAAGRLQVFGRVDDMLNVGGVKIPPDPIQQLLKAEPGVSDAMLLQVETSAAVGMICAMVEVEPDVAHKEVLGRVVEVMRKRAGGAFVVRLETEFPRTETGKVRRKALQARAEASLRDAAAQPVLVDG